MGILKRYVVKVTENQLCTKKMVGLVKRPENLGPEKFLSST